MPDVFVSYSRADHELAKFLHKHLREERLDVFLAPISIEPGSLWRNAILDNLREEDWLLFLASQEACKSSYVQQELGAAIGLEKTIVPVIWDMPPDELPGWIDQKPALNLRGSTWTETKTEVQRTA